MNAQANSETSSSANFQLELTKKYFGENLETCCRLMLKMIKESNIPNISYEDCEDMYNEFFTIAAKTYNPKKSKFNYYLKRIVEYNTFTFIRRVISHHDPLFYCASADYPLENGTSIHDVIGEKDPLIGVLDIGLTSPELHRFNLTPLDKIILYYRGCGFNLKEIAETLNTSQSTVRRRIVKQRKNKKLLQGLAKFD